MLDGNGTPYVLGTVTPLASYNSSTGGNYAIALQARYYQTATAVVAGTANTSMILTMNYQ